MYAVPAYCKKVSYASLSKGIVILTTTYSCLYNVTLEGFHMSAEADPKDFGRWPNY